MPEVSKVILNGTTLMDVTQDTVNSTNTLYGETGHKNDGASFTGELTLNDVVISDVTDSDGGVIRTITTLSNPVMLQSKTVTPNSEIQTIVPDSGYDGLSQVNVNSIPSQYIIPSGTKTITENGTYDVSQYASAEVNVSGGIPELNFAILRVTNTRTSGSETQNYASFNSINYYETKVQNVHPENAIAAVTVNVLGGATRDIRIPYTRANANYIILRTTQSSLEPTISSNYVSVLGHYLTGVVRVTVLSINSGHPDVIEMTVGEVSE